MLAGVGLFVEYNENIEGEGGGEYLLLFPLALDFALLLLLLPQLIELDLGVPVEPRSRNGGTSARQGRMTRASGHRGRRRRQHAQVQMRQI